MQCSGCLYRDQNLSFVNYCKVKLHRFLKLTCVSVIIPKSARLVHRYRDIENLDFILVD